MDSTGIDAIANSASTVTVTSNVVTTGGPSAVGIHARSNSGATNVTSGSVTTLGGSTAD